MVNAAQFRCALTNRVKGVSAVVAFCVCAVFAMNATSHARDPLTAEQFRDRCLKVLHELAPDWRISLRDELSVDVARRGEEFDGNFNFENAFREFLTQSGDADVICKSYVQRLILTTKSADPQATLADVMPVVRACSYLQDLNRKRIEDSKVELGDVLQEPFVGDLCVAYVLDLQVSMSFVHEASLAKLGTDMKGLKASALANLRLRSAQVTIGVGEDLYLVSLPDGYTSSLLLVTEFWNPEKFPVSGGILVFPVSRDNVAVTGTLSRAAPRLAAKARELYRSDPYPLTDRGLERRDDKWQIWTEN